MSEKIRRLQDLILMNDLMKAREAVQGFLQKMREDKIIGSSLDAEIDLYADMPIIAPLHRMDDERRFFFGVSRADLHNHYKRPDDAKETTFPGLWITGSKSTHPKCARCWNHCPEIGLEKKHPEICYRCIDNISDGPGEVRKYV